MATLGYIWEKPEEALSRYIRLKTPFVLSIAGFDPSSGAGVTADLKTFETTGSYGLGVCSAITFQHEDSYTGTHWTTPEETKDNVSCYFKSTIRNLLKSVLWKISKYWINSSINLIQKFPRLKIIWDPILKASAGHIFHENNTLQLNRILPRLFLITPNTEELYQLFGDSAELTRLQK